MSVGVACIATSCFFTLIFNPLFNRRKIALREVLVSFITIVGVLLTLLFVKFFVGGNIGHGIPSVLFAISRKREYMADAGGAELCGNPLALASALRKISGNPGLDNVQRSDVAQLFIMRPDGTESGIMGFMNSLFSTHPDPEKRIAILEQF